MRRYRTLFFFAAILLAGFAVYFQVKESRRRMRAAVYASAVKTYARECPAGLTRKQVEQQLRAKGKPFHHMWRAAGEEAFATIVPLGTEDAPWYCSEVSVHVSFLFEGTTPRNSRAGPDDADLLKSVRLFEQLQGCL